VLKGVGEGGQGVGQAVHQGALGVGLALLSLFPAAGHGLCRGPKLPGHPGQLLLGGIHLALVGLGRCLHHLGHGGL
jgi:hypothetical protein